MKRQVLTVLTSFAAAMISGAVFVPRAVSSVCACGSCREHPHRAASFFLSSAIGDLLDEKKEPNRARNSAVALMTAFLVAFYSLTRFFH
jgi:hypothetical protein